VDGDTAREWAVEGGHLVERCALFVIVALGESILVTGATLAHEDQWNMQVLAAFAIAVVSSLAMWWLYFNTAVHDTTEVIVQAHDPGRYGAFFHYLHVAIVGSVIVTAVGNDLVIAHPDGHLTVAFLLVMLGGPALFLAGNGLYKRGLPAFSVVASGRPHPAAALGLAGFACRVAAAQCTDHAGAGRGGIAGKPRSPRRQRRE
jgi:low temperature requirement protein LtrA